MSHAYTRVQHASAVAVSHDHHALCGAYLGAACDDHLRCAFGERPGLTGVLPDYRHAFALRVEGERPQAGHLRLNAGARDPPFGRDNEQGALRGIPYENGMVVLLAEFGIVTR